MIMEDKMNAKNYWHQLDYVYWKKEAELIRCNFHQFNNVMDRLLLKGEKIPYTTKRASYSDMTYSIAFKGNNKCIYLYENGKYYIYYTNKIDDTKNSRDKAYGQIGIRYINDRLKEDTGVKLRKAFGYTEEYFKRCIPKIFCYSSSRRYNKIYRVSSVDFASHWPACARGMLPTSKGMIELPGTVAPNEEYPFAFYLESGHIAQYQVFDSHNWTKSMLMDAMFRYHAKDEKWPQTPFLDKDKDRTILMKASDYELGKYFEELYNLRKSEADAKMFANASIGFMHRQIYDRYKLAHLAGVITARALQKTIDAMNLVGEMYVLHAVSDGFIYEGNVQIGTKEKQFGELYQEFTNQYFMMKATNCYVVLDYSGKCLKVKHGGYECYDDGSEITEANTHCFDDMKRWKAKRGV